MGFEWIKWMFFCCMGMGVGLALWMVGVVWWGDKKEAVSQRLGNCFCDLESSG